ncbi:unnamed protein product, partial [Notodromas monacha]
MAGSNPPNTINIQSLMKAGISLDNVNFNCANIVNSQGQVLQSIPIRNAKGLQGLANVPKVVTIPRMSGASQGACTVITSGAQPQQIQLFSAGNASNKSFSIPSSNAETLATLTQSGILPPVAAAVLATGKPVTIPSTAFRNVVTLKLAPTTNAAQGTTVVSSGVAMEPKKRFVVKTEPKSDGATSSGIQAVFGRPASPRQISMPELVHTTNKSRGSSERNGVSSSRDIVNKAIAAIDEVSLSKKQTSIKPLAKSGITFSIVDPTTTTPKKRRANDEAADSASDAKKQRLEKTSSKGLRDFSHRVCQKVWKKKTTTYNEVADELVLELSDNQISVEQASNRFDQKNIRRRVYDALNVLMAMGMITKEKKEIRWLGLPTHSDQSYRKLLEEKENLTRANLQKRHTLYELLLQIICFKNLVAKNSERMHKMNGSGEGSSSQPDGIANGPQNRLPIPFLVISTPKDTVIDCNISQDRSEYLLSFSDVFELSDDFGILKKMSLAHGLEECNATDEQINQALMHIPPAFHDVFREIARAPPIAPEMLQDPEIEQMSELVTLSSDDDLSDEDVPDAETCQERIDEFVSVTQTDQAFAQMFLQRRGWDLERSVNEFFQKGPAAGSKPRADLIESVLDIGEDGRSAEINFMLRPVTVPPGGEPPRKRHRTDSGEVVIVSEEDYGIIKFFSWNIDGLSERNLEKRTECVVKYIIDFRVDFALLQEVTAPALSILRNRLSDKYHVAVAKEPKAYEGDLEYEVATCIRKTAKFEYSNPIWKPFPGSRMGRGLQITRVKMKEHGNFSEFPLTLINTHLESTKDFAEERQVQLKRGFSIMEDCLRGPNSVCVFAGDLNLRDTEVVNVGVPKDARDMWEACGAKEHLRYTWDARRNQNCGYFNPKTGARLRFDRANSAHVSVLLESDIKLEGKMGETRVGQGRNTPENLRKVFLGGIGPNTDEDALASYFSKWSALDDSFVLRDPKTKKSKGFAFVIFPDAACVDRVMSCRPHRIDGRSIEVKRPVPNEDVGRPESTVVTTKIFVGAVREEMTEADIEQHFQNYGSVVSVALVNDKGTGRKRGFGFVQFADPDSVDKCLLYRHEHRIGERWVDVKKALSKAELAEVEKKAEEAKAKQAAAKRLAAEAAREEVEAKQAKAAAAAPRPPIQSTPAGVPPSMGFSSQGPPSTGFSSQGPPSTGFSSQGGDRPWANSQGPAASGGNFNKPQWTGEGPGPEKRGNNWNEGPGPEKRGNNWNEGPGPEKRGNNWNEGPGPEKRGNNWNEGPGPEKLGGNWGDDWQPGLNLAPPPPVAGPRMRMMGPSSYSANPPRVGDGNGPRGFDGARFRGPIPDADDRASYPEGPDDWTPPGNWNNGPRMRAPAPPTPLMAAAPAWRREQPRFFPPQNPGGGRCATKEERHFFFKIVEEFEKAEWNLWLCFNTIWDLKKPEDYEDSFYESPEDLPLKEVGGTVIQMFVLMAVLYPET